MPTDETADTIEVSCPAQPWVLPHIRALVCSVASGMGFGEEDVHKIELSVDEACSNAIVHAYTGEEVEGDGRLVVRLIKSTRHLSIQVCDSGRGSSDSVPHAGAQNLDEYLSLERPHGLGTYIMDRMMDEVQFFFPPRQGTIVTLVKRLGA